MNLTSSHRSGTKSTYSFQLHEIVPAVTTCIVSRLLCNRPELDNHWALRDFGARLMSQICKNFNTSTNNLQTRVTRIYSQALQNDKAYLSSLYGAITGLSELGSEVIKVFIIPRLKFISERIEPHLQGNLSNTDKIAAGHIRSSLQKACAPVLKTIRSSPDLIEEYKRDYGYLGASLHQAVLKARSGIAATPSSSSSSAAPIVSISGSSSSSSSSSTIINPGTPIAIKGTNMGIQRPSVEHRLPQTPQMKVQMVSSCSTDLITIYLLSSIFPIDKAYYIHGNTGHGNGRSVAFRVRTIPKCFGRFKTIRQEWRNTFIVESNRNR